MPRLFELRAKLSSLYCEDNGRPATDPVVLAAVTLLQFMEKVPDRVAAEHVVFHLGWKRGFNRVRLSHYLMGAACNVKRYFNLMAFEMRPAALKAA